ncbi:MAG: tRNA uridine-5-carboxymethylaminomethyl(34) synthesis GTPase MnmE [Elusimicrobia bacterium CG_4_9_14_3_um_filter_62_55]|nr:MAG: tRNA uridine-5-carboxymethylaminomethyl(34) synthesis GTPase MnmE [Elusimicrobia bacterium CG22_combo_CG10-13_8_21_14_all_63_91]PJA16635.1 MAG: tRNA uridine-5-carboxymethylaminomethyl(34) synthesis GTPase MnmE [Elusimicrobia bacterium CG_4_10_14_0_2_um_filter_63_34]PJB26426.1 MAG: tRNA uridine-5-carboxymethylaminomethyl(34) synthesis GTPase MnmE [Elusimicrobia bacterium CG_4_9_14_3_um_filter_62_55]
MRSRTIVAIATPPGRGAVGIVRVSGPRADAIARSLTRRGKAFVPRKASLVRIYDGDAPLDEALVVFFPANASYTGEDSVEFQTHGSPYILERLVALCLASGAHSAGPGEFTQRAFLNGRLDLSQAEAVCDLIAARTRLSASAALERLGGGLSRRVAELRSSVLDLRALVEANLDHPDEEIPPLSAADGAARIDALLESLDALARGAARGRLESSARIAIVGAPNAGKSSLLNALLGKDRAIVSERAGTTRDTLDAPIDLAGLDASLVDTAGLRTDARDPVEREGHARALRALEGADLGLVVLDRTLPSHSHGALFAAIEPVRARAAAPLIVVLNKSDLEPARTVPADLPECAGTVELSARSGAGVARLEALLSASLRVPDGEAGRSALTTRHAAAFAAAAKELSDARTILPEDSGELVALHLRSALDALDAIDGKTTTEDLLGSIFSRFCVGK